jgi:two-component system, chemotaxis family, response regulator WspF
VNIAIVNDAPMAVEALRRAVVHGSSHRIAWIARDGAEAVKKCAENPPDLVLMDLIMPVMDGVEATRQIMKSHPCAILVVTATVTGNAGKVYEAMGHGAVDAVNTPDLAGVSGRGGMALLAKIDTISRIISVRKPLRDDVGQEIASFRRSATAGLPILAIGASTGGPQAVCHILERLPGDFPAAIVVIQHIDFAFAEGLARWLDQQTPLRVRVAREEGVPTMGWVDVAATNDHLVLGPSRAYSYIQEPADEPYRPSVDVFFRSLARHSFPKIVSVLLTGMGRDGAEGLLALRKKGHHTIAQDEASCVVYGMPKAAAELQAAAEILSIEKIPSAIVEAFPLSKTNH